MRFTDEQKNWEWYRARWGKITSTRVQPLITGSVRVLNNLLETMWKEWEATESEIMEAYEQDQLLSNKYMAWGTQHEEEAITAFEVQYGINTVRPSFMAHREYEDLVGASMDAIELGSEGEMVRPNEVKCPYYKRRHYANIREGKYREHKQQMQLHIAVLRSYGVDVDGCRFISYHPQVAEDDQVFTAMVKPIEEWQGTLKTSIRAFSRHFYGRTKFGEKREKSA